MAAMAKKLKKAKVPVFDAQSFLNSAGVARRIVEYRDSQKVYSQGDPATSVMYVQAGGVKLTFVSNGLRPAYVVWSSRLGARREIRRIG